MIKPSERVLHAFCRLKAQEFAPFIEYLKENEKDTFDTLRKADGIALSRAQGRAAFIRHLLEDIEGAETLLKK